MRRVLVTVLGSSAAAGLCVRAMAQQAEALPAKTTALASSTAGYFSGYWGVKAFGTGYAGFFQNLDATGEAKLGEHNLGIDAYGISAGGSFDGAARGVESTAVAAFTGWLTDPARPLGTASRMSNGGG